jgi:glutathione S-transferase
MLALTDIPNHFEGRFQTCPIIDFGDQQMSESIAIADRLDAAYPDLPAIFSCPAERAMIAFFEQWLVQEIIVKELLPIYTLDACEQAMEQDRDYYRRSREAHFGRTLEEMVAQREERLPGVRRSLEPVRRTLGNQAFLGGTEPNFADMCLLGVFIFVGTIGTLPLLAGDDPLVAYADRGLACFGSETSSLNLTLSERTL